MLQMGEVREEMAFDCCAMAEEMASKIKSDKPFYVVFHAKPDASINGIRQAFKAYYARPPKMIGVLVWYVNHPLGEFRFMPELSSPLDIPIDPSLLSDRSEDKFERVMEKGKELKVLVS
jgi:hypothetical protein